MKTLFLIATTVIGTLAITVTAAEAVTCEKLAALCMKNGGTKAVCYGAPLAGCKRTCTYVGAYSGKRFPASGDCGGKGPRKS